MASFSLSNLMGMKIDNAESYCNKHNILMSVVDSTPMSSTAPEHMKLALERVDVYLYIREGYPYEDECGKNVTKVYQAKLYKNGLLVETADMCYSCETYTNEIEGCMCSLPKGYCHECDDVKCHKYHY